MFTSIKRLQQERVQRHQVKVEVFGLDDRYASQDISSWEPVPAVAFPVVGPRAFGWAPAMLPAVKRFEPDVVHVHGIWMYYSVVSSAAHHQMGTPYMVHPHGMLDPWAVQRSSWKKRIARVLYEDRHLGHASCIRALCQAEAHALREFGVRGPVCIVPNGIDLPEERDPGPSPWAEVVEPGRKVLLFMSRIHEKKGLPHLITAWSRLLERERSLTEDWALVIAGWDTTGHQPALQQLVRELQLEHVVKFVGPLFNEQKDEALRHASGFVLPSYSEGLPMTVLEAWAYSLPVVMTPQCNLPEGFQAQAAVRVEAEPLSIESGLRDLMQMTGLEREGMGERGRLLVRDQYQWNVVARDIHAVDEWILGGGPAPDCVVGG